MELSPRKEKILSSVVRDYVRSGEPVGSKALADEVGVSSATVRNEMAELTELGLLEQPHTSAGRVPSPQGYRVFVDRLMEVPELSAAEKRTLEAELHAGGYEPERLLRRVCQVLAGASRCAAVVTTPSGARAKVQGVQFVQTSRRTAMLLLMSSAGTMKTRVFHCDFDLTGDMMRVFFRLFNEKLAGREVAEITPAFLQTMAVSLGDVYALAASPLTALLEAARDTLENEAFVSGQMSLLFWPELPHRQVLDLLDSKDRLAALLEQKPGRVTALIGEESGVPALRDAAVLASRYTVGEQDAGGLGLIGPMRMDYPRLTAVLQYLTGGVSRMLTALMREE